MKSRKQPDNQPEDGTFRGRPGRRTAEERKTAVLEVLSGKASVEQVAIRFGVTEETVNGWREDALEAIGSAFRRDGKSAREQELERENRKLRAAITESAIEVALIKQALSGRPSQPGKSRK